MWAAEAIANRNIPLTEKEDWSDMNVIPKGSKITITKGQLKKYALWSFHGIWDLDEIFVDESTIKILSE